MNVTCFIFKVQAETSLLKLLNSHLDNLVDAGHEYGSAVMCRGDGSPAESREHRDPFFPKTWSSVSLLSGEHGQVLTVAFSKRKQLLTSLGSSVCPEGFLLFGIC
ncbi:unnamed protein product [Arctogadus glacialis]